jgi:CD2 antigen cytoplasmic tail-binding protein 2
MSRPSVRPKRAGEEFTRVHHGADDSDLDGPSSSKKLRFDIRNPSALAPDALEEDAILDADVIGRRGRGVRRDAVNIDGFESDSENEGFDARVEAKAKAQKGQQGDETQDDDIFAQPEEDFQRENDDADATGKKKKSVHFLKDEDIEGQVESSRGGRSVRVDLSRPDAVDEDPDSESESDIPDEERARLDEGIDEEVGAGGKKTHAPLLDAFNMRAEQEEGRFDEQGNFVRKAADPDAIHDSWLEGLSKKDIRRAREAAEKRDAERRDKDRENDSILTADLLRTLIPHLHLGETVLEALARLGKGQRKKPKWQNKLKNKAKSKISNDHNGAVEDVEMTEDDPVEAARKKAIDDVTGAADLLLSRGQTDIYDAERERLIRQFRRETGEEWVDPPELSNNRGDSTRDNTGLAGPTMWEYRWSDARDGGETHGPYDSATMQSWSDAGYFGEGVEFRRAGDPTSDWSRVLSFT